MHGAPRRVYIEEEMAATATDSPFRADGAIAGIMQALQGLKCDDSKDIRKLVESVEMLARVRARAPRDLCIC